MKIKKLMVLIAGTVLFLNLHAALITHLKFEDDFQDNYGDNNGNNKNDPYDVSFGEGREGVGIYFDGNDYFEIGNGDFNPRGTADSYSISLWVKSTEAASSSNANCYIGKHTDTGGNVFLLGYWSSTLRLQIRSTYVTVSTSAEPLEWTHYVVTAKESGTSTSAKVYRNGAQIWSGTVNNVLGTFNIDDKPWVLGQDWDSSSGKSDWFKGYMDNVRFYDNELDAAYVRQIFLKESSYVHLKFDDDFNDSVGSNHGSQAGGVVFRKGLENRSAFFDGYDDYLEFGTALTDPRVTNGVYKDFSMSIWVKSYIPATTTVNHSYIGKHTTGNSNIFLFGYFEGALKIRVKAQVATVSTASEPTLWTHYLISGYEYSSANTTTMKVFKNGEQIWEGTLNDTMGSFSSTKPWVLGQDWDVSGPSDHFYGEIDNFRFYKRRLNTDYADEVQQLYLSEFSGLRYCDQTQYLQSCTITTENDKDLSDNGWWFLPPFYTSPLTSIESIKVSEGWEAYLCTSANSQGTCHYFDDGVYASGGELPSALVNSTYSITVQPKTFDSAKKYFGYKKVGESGNLPVGFAYFYQYANYAKPSKSNDRRRLFMDSYSRNQIPNMSNTILGSNRTTSAELYGNVYANLEDDSQNDKDLMTSHRDFAIEWSSYNDWPVYDFRSFNDNVKKIWLNGHYEQVGTVGWFLSDDAANVGLRRYTCLKGIDENYDAGDVLRIECMPFGANYFAFESGVGTNDDEFYERVYSGNKQKFEKYADNYSLLMLTGHGSFLVDTNNGKKEAAIAIPNVNYYADVYFTSYNWNNEKKLGKLNTKWVEITACDSMGEDGDAWLDVGDAYYNVLTRLNGVGGYRNNSTWEHPWDTHNYYAHWDDLLRENMTISDAWVTAWSEDLADSLENGEWHEWDRDARFLTLENCNCTLTTCTSYMKNDYFFNVQTGPRAQKTTTTGYNYYCFRDREDPEFRSYTRSAMMMPQEESYPEEFAAYSIYSVPDKIVEELAEVKIGGKETKSYSDEEYTYEDEWVRVKKSGKDLTISMNRKLESFEYDEDWEYTAKDKFEEAKAIAESLTTLDLEYAGISKDVTEAFEVGGNGESLGKNVNSIRFVFRPKIDGLPVFIEDITVDYDAAGLQRIKSRTPYSISLSRKGKIKSEEEAVAEMAEKVKMEEAENGKVIFTLDENYELSLSYMTGDKEKSELKSISLEAKDE